MPTTDIELPNRAGTDPTLADRAERQQGLQMQRDFSAKSARSATPTKGKSVASRLVDTYRSIRGRR